MKTGFLTHELYMWHDTGTASLYLQPGLTVEPDEHAESPKTKRRMRNLMEVSGIMDDLELIKPVAAQHKDITRFHTEDYVARLQKMSNDRGGDAGELTPFGPGSFEIAMLSAGGVISAAEAVWSRQVKNAYALVRPPGHHAEADWGRGFCMFGNVAIAAMKLLAQHGAKRIAVVDWDVHHGNGTQSAFWDRDDVLMISIHQDDLYPKGTGHIDERGEGAGEGYTINVPLPPGSGTGAYEQTFRQIVVPALEAYQPDMIIVSSGFDAGAVDPLGRMMMHSGGYRTLTQMLMDAADKLCGGKLLMAHEGGYSPNLVPYCGLAVMEQLSGVTTDIVDPMLDIMAGYGQQALQQHQAAAIDAACKGVLEALQ
ncbi:class II histone deacetylase [uncultured Roseovarius sp.]|uniref:class II histone deacetylase n=1 Tax=uncultured Roseovarius sp. TaxID=293344 RepID=UPI00261372F6|nr:class II histone deacetylase [uncultured Roseovarius sp.]